MKKALFLIQIIAVVIMPLICYAQCVTPPGGMVGWWPGDSNADDLIGGNNGTLMNGATFASGMVSQAFSFDGVDDYVNIGNTSQLNPSTITVDTWFYATDITGQLYPPLVKKSSGNDGYALEIDQTNFRIRFWVYITGTGWVSSVAVPISTNTWYHVAGTYDGSNIIIYLNGQPQGSPVNVSGTIAPSPSPLNIGRDPLNTNRFFEGRIDEVEIFERALSAPEILQIYNAGSDGKCKFSTVVPALNEWGIIIFVVFSGLGAVYLMRKKPNENI